MSTPMVPPRPVARQAPPAEIEASQQPPVPPRPAAKQRGVSPGGRPFVQSPFHEKYDPLQLTKSRSVDPIRRPPSVSAMPGLGSEGYEYGEIQYQQPEPLSALAADAAAQTKTLPEDLKLHAPKPSLPKQSATAQVQAVTRTDTASAGSPGIVRPPSQDPEALGRGGSRASFSRPDSAASDHRRRSYHDEGPGDTGGIRVPINPLLGDVQAPSPAPSGLTPHHTGASHESKSRRHHSTSGRDSVPPGAYGLHGHGMHPLTSLDKDWYSKHPSELEHEEVAGHGVYESIGSGRGAFALSSDDLNKIVRNTASRGTGFGTSGNVPSYPDEQIGYQASEQYSRKDSNSHRRTPSNVPASPLRTASYPHGDASPEVRRRSLSRADSDVEDIHIDAPAKRYNKVTGGETTMRETEDVKPYATHPTEEDGLINEHGYSVPILADDEVAKEVGHEHLQPAVSPSPRRGSGYDDPYRSSVSPHGSRPSSRPGSIHGLHSSMHHGLTRYVSHHDDREHVHTPLEDVEEYEPLFPEKEEKAAMTTAERFKQRPESLRHRFPSQDIWEDTPDSAMYQAEVTTPDLPKTEKMTSLFEPPEAEQARKGEVSEAEKEKLVPSEERLLQSRFAPHLRDDMPTRPGLQPRFPSQDVWEDSPDSQHLVATVGAPEDEPVVPQRPEKSRLGEGASTNQIEPSVVPSIPPRPQKTAQQEAGPSQSGLKKVPSIPDRPKPQVPARPAKKDPEELSKVISGGSDGSVENVTSPPVPKAKPQVPARPAGSKIANLRSNFMSDLNQKLGLGPPKEKEKEPEPEPEEVKPLEDARKSRARGPQRRAPPKSANAPARPSPLSFSISAPQSLWSIDEGGSLNVAKAEAKISESKLAQMEHSTPADTPMAPTIDTTSKAEIATDKRADDASRPLAPALSTNTAGESTDPTPFENVSELNRAETSHSIDADLASKQTTASDVSGATLTHVESIDPAVRTEDVNKPVEVEDE